MFYEIAAKGNDEAPAFIQADDIVDTIATGILPPEPHGEWVRVRVISQQEGRAAYVVGSFLLTKQNLCTAILVAARDTVLRGFHTIWH